MKRLVISVLESAIARARAAGSLTATPANIAVEAPKDPAHGDIASNVALTLARAEGKPPRVIAAAIGDFIELAAGTARRSFILRLAAAARSRSNSLPPIRPDP